MEAIDRMSRTGQKGLNADIVRDISAAKGEPQWMCDFRLKALKAFLGKSSLTPNTANQHERSWSTFFSFCRMIPN